MMTDKTKISARDATINSLKEEIKGNVKYRKQLQAELADQTVISMQLKETIFKELANNRKLQAQLAKYEKALRAIALSRPNDPIYSEGQYPYKMAEQALKAGE